MNLAPLKPSNQVMHTKTLALMAALLLLPLMGACSNVEPAPSPCGPPGAWLIPAGADSRSTEPSSLMRRLAGQQAVLLGETHDSAEDHRWQLHTLGALHALRPELAIGLEMFPRRLQPVLDRWVAGGLSEADFLRQGEWDKVWGYDAQLYLPLFHFARMHRLPLLAVNVERGLVEAVGERGWDGVPEGRREGVGRPAAPLPAYLKELRQIYAHHPEKKQDDAGFARFVEAQTLWDRAMAEGIAAHLRAHPQALVVGILGSGHVRHGYGVAHQLADLGVGRVAKLTTWDAAQRCADLPAGLADAVYLVQPPADNPPRLGIAMEPAKEGVRIVTVQAGSVAQAAGLQAGDLVLAAAGRNAESTEGLRRAVQRQPPGTWLPLQVRRGDTVLEMVARFPAER